MSDERADTAFLLKAVEFASRKHSTQRRKNAEASPYINHPIAVAHLLADTSGITDLITLMAAVPTWRVARWSRPGRWRSCRPA
jgi:guanosine-3',5'-bis(diphosphate) 3'-pyrophosphohydrolase